MKIETPRLLIRPPVIEDLPSTIAIWSHPLVQKFLGRTETITEEQIIKGFHDDLKLAGSDFGFRTVIEKETGTHIGDSGLLKKEVEGTPEVELVYFFNPTSWSKGYATEAAIALKDYAFNELKLTRIISLIHPENQASKNVAKKVGLTYERNAVTASGNTRELFSRNP